MGLNGRGSCDCMTQTHRTEAIEQRPSKEWPEKQQLTTEGKRRCSPFVKLARFLPVFKGGRERRSGKQHRPTSKYSLPSQDNMLHS